MRVSQDLLRKAEREGSVRVIVHLAIPNIVELLKRSNAFFKAPSDPDSRARALEADRPLAEVLSRVARVVLSGLDGLDFHTIRTFRVFPFLALRVSPPALKKLSTLSEVIGVQEDMLTPLPDDLFEISSLADPLEGPDLPALSQSVPLIGADAAWDFGYTGAG